MDSQGRIIRVPYHMVKILNKLVQTQRRLLQEYGREPTAKEVTLEMGQLSSKDTQAIKDALAKNQRVDPDLERRWERAANKIQRILPIAQEPVSPVDMPIVLDERDILASLKAGTVFEPVDAALRQLKEQLLEVLDTLTERERQVLEMRFGLVDGESHTLEEVGNAFGVTRERIRQIEAKALRKLSTADRSRKS